MSDTIKTVLILMAVCIVFTGMCPAVSEQPKAKELLDKISESLNKRQSLIVKTESSRVSIPDKSDDRVDRFSVELRYDGERASRRRHVWGNGDPSFILKKDEALYDSSLWDGNDHYQYDLVVHKSVPDKSGKVIITRGKEKNNKKYSISNAIVGSASYSSLMGFFDNDNERVDRILRSAEKISVLSRMQKINGSDCHVLEANTKRGRYTLWIDPAHGNNIARARVNKRAGDLAFSSDYRLKDKERIDLTISNVRFEKKDGIWTPVEADIENSRFLKGVFSDKTKRHVKVKEIVLNPDHDALGSFKPDDINSGARVRIKGPDTSTYTWQNGELVKAESDY